MNLIPGNIPVLFLVLILGVCLASALPMTAEQEQKGLQSVGSKSNRMVKSEAESEFIGRIPPNGDDSSEEPAQYDIVTLVEELEAAGVQSADRRDLHTLTYKELVRLLALWHLAQTRNVYDSKGPDEQPDQAIDAR
ncbi:uncharacterized protein LOC108117599 [Drosophila eugracilis]|uniref:uncharacterized protein LOC108117599 n=1 Tax=Drosophila eugracilis TaxID=29029 RepID=UPI0007E7F9E4|nr:uncharacterized protein LOC108117599 [Drosophila eugracilis]